MVALQKDRAGLVDFIINLAAGGFVALDVVVDLYAVHCDGYPITNHRCFNRLPFAGRLSYEFVGSLEIVDRTVPADGGLT